MAKGRIGIQIPGANGERFRIEDRIGNGAFGEVYKAIGVDSGTIVALKLVPQNKVNNPSTLALKSVLNEGRVVMLNIDHPNVVRVLHVDTGSDPALGPYIMMEYVEGGTLHELLDIRRRDKKLLTIEEARSLMRKIALGVQAVNEHLVHRDIKPDNILLAGPADAPQPKIGDFGIAKIAGDPTRPETFKGIQMIWYMAPEVWRNEKNTPKIDCYSVGLVFYEILTLNHPLLHHVPDPSDFVRWREVHLTERCPDIRNERNEVSLSLAKLLLRMTDKSPGNRPGWGEVLNSLDLDASRRQPENKVDPHLLTALKNLANERLRQDETRAVEVLASEREAERDRWRREEYDQSAGRLIARFDEVVEALNQHEPGYPIRIEGDGLHSRSYLLPNGHEVRCQIFEYLNRPIPSKHGQVLGGGFLGIPNALSANLVLFGEPDDIAGSSWLAVEANIFALIGGDKRLELYRRARLSDDTIRFVETMDGNPPWRRGHPTFFGFEVPSLFFKHFPEALTMTDVYSFRVEPDVMRTFNQMLALALKMPV